MLFTRVLLLIAVGAAHAVFGRTRLTQLVATLVKFSAANDFAVVKLIAAKRAAVGLLTRLLGNGGGNGRHLGKGWKGLRQER